MKRIAFIGLIVTFAVFPSVFAEIYSSSALSYSVIIDYNDGALSLKDILLIKANPMSANMKTGEYTAKIISFKDETLFETRFNINLEPFYSMPLSKETAKSPRKLTKTSFDLLLPYYSNAKTLQILKDKKILLEIDLSKFSTCNENKICDGSESVEACPSDCTCGNNVCDENENYDVCSADCGMKEAEGMNILLILGAVIIFGLIFCIVLMKKVGKKKKIMNREL